MTRMFERVYGRASLSSRTCRKNNRASSFRVEGLETRTMMSVAGTAATLPSILPVKIAVDTFSDGNFASPAQKKAAPNDYAYNPTGSPWVFTGQAGVSGNGSGFTAANNTPVTPTGTQVAFVQETGAVSQSFELSPGTYSVSFQASQRAPANHGQASFQAVDVWVDNNLVDLVVPASTGYTSYQTTNFTVSGTGTHTLEFKGVDPLAGDNTAFITKVSVGAAATKADPNEPALLAQAVTDLHRDGSLNYNDMLALFSTAESEVPAIVTYHSGTGKGSVFSQGGLPQSVMDNLQTIVADAACLQMPADVSNLASKVVDGNAANATYQSLSASGAVTTTTPGNLHAATTTNDYLGSSVTQLEDLVNKWFLGGDYPVASYSYAPATTGSGTVTSLYGGGSTPLYTDVLQGTIGDCYLLASFEEAALKTPSIVENMFHYEGNDIWSVRLYNNGSPTFVTVNNELPAAGTQYDHPAPDGALWVSLAEKAYAEVAAGNSYLNLDNGGQSAVPMTEITGRSVWSTSFKLTPLGLAEGGATSISIGSLTGSTELTSENHLASQIYSAFESGQLVTMGSNGNGTNGEVVPNHMYAVIGASLIDGAYSFILGNPWGPNGAGGGSTNYYPGMVPDAAQLHAGSTGLSENNLFSNFDSVAFTLGTSPSTATKSSSTATGSYGSGVEAGTTTALHDAAISGLVSPDQTVAARVDVSSLSVVGSPGTELEFAL